MNIYKTCEKVPHLWFVTFVQCDTCVFNECTYVRLATVRKVSGTAVILKIQIIRIPLIFDNAD